MDMPSDAAPMIMIWEEAGYKFNSLKGDPVNLLMGIDINTGVPLFYAYVSRGMQR